MSRSDIRKLERGVLQPSARQIARLANAFGIDVKELLPAFYPPRRSEEEFDTVEADLRHARSENERLRAQNERLQAENNDLMTRLTTLPFSGGLSSERYRDHEMVKDLLSLIKISHPDRHAGHALAVELTQALLALKEKYEGRKAAW
jgi:transcriptional regulator with XRE-family HTH domain